MGLSNIYGTELSTTVMQDECCCFDDIDYGSEEETFTCEKCGDLISEDEVEWFGNQCLCESCIDEYTVICKDCEGRVWREDAYDVGSGYICQRCYDRYYTTCVSCDRIISIDNSYRMDEDDDDDYCERCYNEKKREYIQSYYYKPCPTFFADDGSESSSYPGSGIFYGVELEIDCGGESDKNAGILQGLANAMREHIYIKRDGSLQAGLELVTHPMTLKYHTNQMPWRDVMMQALRMGYRSHDCPTCGLHIHVGREALSGDYEAQDAIIGRILYFIERHWDELLIFSRRTEDSLNRWAARYGLRGDVKETLKNAKDQNSGRYVCLNLSNYNTIEWRVFRGTLRYETLLAALQLVDELTVTAINLTDEDFHEMTWDAFVSKIDESQKPELVQYLKKKGLYDERGEC